jgi:hypothetical protein
VVNAVAELQGNVRSAIILPCEEAGCRAVTLWVEDASQAALAEALTALQGTRLTGVWSPGDPA